MSEPVLLCKKRSGMLSPADARARSIVQHMSLGECAYAQIRRARNPKLHRKFFALVQFAFDNWRVHDAPAAQNIDRFRKDLTIAAGFYEVVLGIDGKSHLEAKSIAWDKMGEEEFTPLYEKVVEVLAEGFIPGMTPAQAERFAMELEAF